MGRMIGCLWAVDLNNLSLFPWVTLGKLFNMFDLQVPRLKRQIKHIPHRVVNTDCTSSACHSAGT